MKCYFAEIINDVGAI